MGRRMGRCRGLRVVGLLGRLGEAGVQGRGGGESFRCVGVDGKVVVLLMIMVIVF